MRILIYFVLMWMIDSDPTRFYDAPVHRDKTKIWKVGDGKEHFNGAEPKHSEIK